MKIDTLRERLFHHRDENPRTEYPAHLVDAALDIFHRRSTQMSATKFAEVIGVSAGTFTKWLRSEQVEEVPPVEGDGPPKPARVVTTTPEVTIEDVKAGLEELLEKTRALGLAFPTIAGDLNAAQAGLLKALHSVVDQVYDISPR